MRPELADTTGSGNPRQYSATNLLEFAIAKELVGLGIGARQVERFLRIVRRELPGFWELAGAIFLARAANGELTFVHFSPVAHGNHWQDFVSEATPKRDVGTWIVLDLDVLRERLELHPAASARPRRATRSR